MSEEMEITFPKMKERDYLLLLGAAVLVPTFQNMANRVESEASVTIPRSSKAVNVNVLG